MTRTELLAARIAQVTWDAGMLHAKLQEVSGMTVEAGEQAERRVRDIEGNLACAMFWLYQLAEFATPVSKDV